MVTVYSKERCVQCNATVRKLEELGVSYTLFKVDEDYTKVEWLKNELGYQQVPVVIPSFDHEVVDEKEEKVVHWSGFRPDYLDQLVK